MSASTSTPSESTGTSFEPESFLTFFNAWLNEQNQHLHDLLSAAENLKNNAATASDVDSGSESTKEEDVVGALIERVVGHYEHYYDVKSNWTKKDAITMLMPPWRSSLEEVFLWIGGWRPTTAFHLLYSKSGIQLENHLDEIIRGFKTGDLGDLSPEQMIEIDSLQRQTVRREREISEQMAKRQEEVADPDMVELSHAATQLIILEEEEEEEEEEKENIELAITEKRLKWTMDKKVERMKEMVHMADQLRLATLKGIIHILSQKQRLHFLIAAAELHLRIHDWGMQNESLTRRKFTKD